MPTIFAHDVNWMCLCNTKISVEASELEVEETKNIRFFFPFFLPPQHGIANCASGVTAVPLAPMQGARQHVYSSNILTYKPVTTFYTVGHTVLQES